MAMASSSSATVAVDKATSDLLISPDWTMNIDICDSINSNHWQAKDVVKAVKKRLQHRNPGVQLLALTLLETMVKNCGDFVHFQIVEKNILGEMVKIVKKKADLHVRDKILVLLDSWQEAFGGAGGKYPQYYWACEDVRRSGIEFPPRSLDAAPVFTPPLTHTTLGGAIPGFGMPGGSTRRLDETMAADPEGLSLSSLESMRNVMDLLSDMLQAVGPDDREAVKDEVIVDLVERCRSNQKKLMQMLTTTGDEELLIQGLELNDSLQTLLAKHDAIASGSPMPSLASQLRYEQRDGSSSNMKPNEVNDQTPEASTEPIAPVSNFSIEDDEEEEDDFSQLARRHSKPQPTTEAINGASSGALVPIETYQTSSAAAPSIVNPRTPAMNRQEQDIIDLLSLTLSTNNTSSQSDTSQTTPTMPQIPVSSPAEAYTGGQGLTTYDSYVAPWAQSQPQHHSQPPQIPSPSESQPHLHQQHPQYSQQPQIPSPSESLPPHQQHPHYSQQPQIPSPSQSQPHLHQHHQHYSQQPQISSPSESLPPHQQHPHYSQHPQIPSPSQSQPHLHQHHPHYSQQPQIPSPSHSQPHLHQQHPQFQHQSLPQSQQPQFHPQQQQSQYPQYSSGYPPPPWAGTPGYTNSTSQTYTSENNTFSRPQGNNTTSSFEPMQSYSSSPSAGNNGESFVGSGTRAAPAQPSAQKSFVPSYKLFDDLNVLGNAEGKSSKATTNNGGPSLSSSSGQSMVDARK
ncbi:TOM1-like protein 6 [Linum perenne]